MDIQSLKLILTQQQERHEMQQKLLIEQLQKQHLEQMAELLQHRQNLVQGENGDVRIFGGESASRKIKDLSDSMLQFDYEPEDNSTFDTWFSRYKSMFTDEARELQDSAKIRLLLMKFPNSSYQRYADSILPKEPHEFTFDETIKKLKLLFGHRQTKFALRQKCFSIVKNDSEDFVQYAAKINKHAEKFDITSCKSDDFKVQLFIAGLKSPNDSLILKKLLTKCDSQYVQLEALTDQAEIDAFKKLNLQDLVNEAERILCLKKDKSTIGEASQCKSEIHSVQQQQHEKGRKFNNWNKTPKCRRCLDTHFHKDCPFLTKECSKCKEVGHQAGFCDSFKTWQQNMKMRRERRKSDPTHRSVQSLQVSEVKKICSQRKFIEPCVNDTSIKLQFDTASDITIISRTNWAKLGKPTLKSTSKTAASASGDSVPLLGSFPCVVKLNGREEYAECNVSDRQLNLFGIDWIEKFELWSIPISNICNNIKTSNNSELKNEILKEFPLLFSAGLGCCTKTKASLTLKQKFKPIYRNARPVPQAAESKIATELQRLQHLGVITPVSYSDFAAPIVVVKKKNGELRICADYSTGLNDSLEPDKYPLPTPDQIFAKLANKKIFSKLDISDAFFQIEFDKTSSEIATINTHLGLFRVNRLQQGVKTAPGTFQRIIDKMLSGKSAFGFIDDMVVAGIDETEHKRELFETLKSLQDYGFKLKIEKCEFGKAAIEFCGHVIDKTGIRPHPDKLLAIQDLPVPADISQLRSFLGSVNFYGKYVDCLKSYRGPLDNLLRKDEKFEWKTEHTQAFKEIKAILSSDLVLTHFDPKKKLILATDASQYAMGATLLHEFDDGTLHPIMHWSGSFNSAEKNYPQMHKEARALVFGLKRAHFYIAGRHFTIHIDHKPLIAIFGSKTGIPIYTAARLQRYALTVLAYDFDIKYIDTESFGYADVISRLIASHNRPDEETVIAVIEIQDKVSQCFAIETAKSLPIRFTDIKNGTILCPVLSEVKNRIEKDDWPQKKSQLLSREVANFFELRNHLTVIDGCIFFGERIVVPQTYRRQILIDLHQGHPGEARTKLYASSKVFWPGINSDIEAVVKTCEKCATSSKSPIKCSLKPWPIPVKPWSRLHLDYAGPIDGNYFLVIVDAFSKWVEVFRTTIITAKRTIEMLSESIAQHGLCDTIVTDNGTQFVSSEFEEFCESQGIKHLTSSPYHPQSNGQAEKFVELLKTGLKKATGNIDQKLREFLFCYRFTPSYNLGMKSPSELLNNRKMKTKLDLLKPQPSAPPAVNTGMQEAFDSTHGAKWKEFVDGDRVYYQLHSSAENWKWVPANIIKKIGQVNYKIQIDLPDNQRIVKAHANQMKARHLRNEFNELFEVPDFQETLTGNVEPVIVPQFLPAAEQQPCNDDLDQSDEFQDALDDSDTGNSINQDVPTPQPEAPQVRRSERANKGIPPNYLRF